MSLIISMDGPQWRRDAYRGFITENGLVLFRLLDGPSDIAETLRAVYASVRNRNSAISPTLWGTISIRISSISECWWKSKWRKGPSCRTLWTEIQELIETRRKLADSEGRRLATLQQTITAERAMLLMGVIVDIIARHISDRQVLSNIATDLQRLGSVGDAAYGLPERRGDHE